MSKAAPLKVERKPLWFKPDPRRVVLRPFIPANGGRVRNILGRLARLDEQTVATLLATVLDEFRGRHNDLESVLRAHYEKVRANAGVRNSASKQRQLLIGACFTAEYALESAALFNPSIVSHPDQDNVPPGWIRFVMSFRATGEGHISSIEFRTGIVNECNEIVVERPGRFVTQPLVEPDPAYQRDLFVRKLAEMGFDDVFTQEVMGGMRETFTLGELQQRLRDSQPQGRPPSRAERRTRDAIRWLVESNYRVRFDASIPLAERIIFPVSPSESNGIEDARFVRFVDDDDTVRYYATYTAYNGRAILPNLLETKDFLTFDVHTLNGRAAQNKGMALFPRRIAGRYAMISRQDNENIFVMFSDKLHFWNDEAILIRPKYSWEIIQLGNCGSPIETDAGWLLLTHGVGPMRKYCIGAILLDRDNPAKVVGRLPEPLLAPNAREREGYVPNVVYTCGAMLHNGRLIIPYAVSDTSSSIATVSLSDLMARMVPAD